MEEFDGKKVMGTNTRAVSMQEKCEGFKKKLLLLAVRVYCAKRARKMLPIDATTDDRNAAYMRELRRMKERLNDQNSSEYREIVKGLQEAVGIICGNGPDVEKDCDIQGARPYNPPFGMTEFLTVRPRAYMPKPGTVAMDGWNCDDLRWMFGRAAVNIRETLVRIGNGEFGDYWQEKLSKATCNGLHGGNRYNDEIFGLYFNFLQFKYLLLLKEAKRCGKTPEEQAELNSCGKDEIQALKAVVDQYNKLAADNNLPKTECWNDAFDRELGVHPESESEW